MRARGEKKIFIVQGPVLLVAQERANAHAPSGAADDLKSASDSTHPDPRLARAP
jgi:hypothetical protein